MSFPNKGTYPFLFRDGRVELHKVDDDFRGDVRIGGLVFHRRTVTATDRSKEYDSAHWHVFCEQMQVGGK